jgi:hypothetical protein
MSGTAYATIAESVSREIRTASKKEFDLRWICGRFYADLARLPASRVESKNVAEFRLQPAGWPFFE